MVVLTFFFLTVGMGGKVWKGVTTLFIILGYISIVMLIVILLAASHSGFVSAFNGVSKMPYDQVVPTAQALGWSIPTWSIAGTLAGLPYAVLFYLGFERGTYIAGETKKVSWAMPFGTFLSLGLGAFFFMVSIPLLTGLVGEDWYKALLWLYYEHPEKYPLTIPPGPNLVATMAAVPAVVIIFSILFVVWGMMGNLSRFQSSHVACSWSFDRIIPTAMSKVSDRFHTPLRSVFLYYVGALIITYIAYFTNVLSFFFSILGLGYLIRVIIYVAAAAMPYRANSKRIYQLSPMKPSILKVPLITISGIISAGFFLYMSYQTYTKLMTKTFWL